MLLRASQPEPARAWRWRFRDEAGVETPSCSPPATKDQISRLRPAWEGRGRMDKAAAMACRIPPQMSADKVLAQQSPGSCARFWPLEILLAVRAIRSSQRLVSTAATSGSRAREAKMTSDVKAGQQKPRHAVLHPADQSCRGHRSGLQRPPESVFGGMLQHAGSSFDSESKLNSIQY